MDRAVRGPTEQARRLDGADLIPRLGRGDAINVQQSLERAQAQFQRFEDEHRGAFAIERSVSDHGLLFDRAQNVS